MRNNEKNKKMVMSDTESSKYSYAKATKLKPKQSETKGAKDKKENS